MNSIKCTQCGLVNWSTDEACKRCASPLGNPGSPQMPYQASGYSAAPPAGGYSNYSQGYQPYYTAPPANQKIGMAIASMVLSLIGCATAPLGLILGIVAYKKAKRYPLEYGGKGFAVAGIVISSLMMFVFVPVVAALAIPNLLASRRAANEGTAMSSLRKIAAAEARYIADGRTQQCGDLSDLGRSQYVDPVLAGGEKSGYRFVVSNFADGGCEIYATPISNSTGTRSFYISSEEGILRGANKIGLKAGPQDPVIGN